MAFLNLVNYGHAEAIKALNNVDANLSRKAMRIACRYAYGPIMDEAKKTARGYAKNATKGERKTPKFARKGTRWRLIANAIGIKQKTYKRNTIIYTGVGVRHIRTPFGNKGKIFNPAPLAYILEYGTSPHAIGKGSSRRDGGQQGALHMGAKPMPFLRPAFDGNKRKALNRLFRYMRTAIRVAARRESKRFNSKVTRDVGRIAGGGN